MLLRLHPSSEEAITLDRRTFTRWSLLPEPRALCQLSRADDSPWDRWAEPERCAITPDGSIFAVPFGDAPTCTLELRRWSDLSVVDRLLIPDTEVGITSLDFSADSRWLVVADYRVLLVDRTTKRIVTSVDGNEWTTATLFAPQSDRLAVACTGQGGGGVSIYTIVDGQFHLLQAELTRVGIQWPQQDFADTFTRMAFSPDGHVLVLYATSEWGAVTPDWQGEVIAYDVVTGRRRWYTPIDARTTGIAMIADSQWHPADVLFTSDGATIMCGSASGHVIVMDAEMGNIRDVMALSDTTGVYSLAMSASGALWALVDNMITRIWA